MATTEVTVGEVKLRDVRLSFEHVFVPTASVKDGPKKYRASFLIDPSSPEGKKAIREIERAISEVENEVWGKTGVKFKDDRTCYLDGDDCTNSSGDVYDGYDGMKVIKAANSRRPVIKDRDGKTPLGEEDGKIYSGCYVNAIVRLYGIKDADKGGNGLFASLEGLQFVRHGKAFTARGLSDDAFEDLGGDDDDDLVD